MTLIEVINELDAIKPNTYTQDEKIKWLSELDGMIKSLVIDTHEGNEDITFDGYTPDTSLDTKLIIDSPYDELYIRWLESKVDYANAEYVKYNNSITRYNDLYQAFCNDYNRKHMPKGIQNKYF